MFVQLIIASTMVNQKERKIVNFNLRTRVAARIPKPDIFVAPNPDPMILVLEAVGSVARLFARVARQFAKRRTNARGSRGSTERETVRTKQNKTIVNGVVANGNEFSTPEEDEPEREEA
ncbi:hypothetical protein niasHT_016812 [Heterodera trifolii]|uniref:Uncharacterized protein n=1 Tax=Heterodera trifolii TaxID=157864 RepID=A0ABD2KZ66_9BILA